ncbi:hypothetical protein [Alicyclobacillus fodiniaquatilis]|uniref:Uncharacterized protein n=1 Tax=Alicyclobacillus fodiniaquatilis TaxID=1661150 RepID=A0ABW4JDE8_9BACL
MSWYTINYQCGHEGDEQIYGPIKDRKEIAERRGQKLCPDCYKEEVTKKREVERLQATEKAQTQNLPELVGSEKQVAWAQTIRMKSLESVEKYMENRKPGVIKNADMPMAEQNIRWMKRECREFLEDKSLGEFFEIVTAGIDILRSQTSASWWIDHRQADTAEEMIETALGLYIKTH